MPVSDTEPLIRLRAVLARASGTEVSAAELAEVLWLAASLPASADEPGAPSCGLSDDGPDGVPPAEGERAGREAPYEAPPLPDEGRRPRNDGGAGRTSVHRPPSGGNQTSPMASEVPYRQVLAPVPPMLCDPLRLQRSLRPLKRTVPSPVGRRLDEEATVRSIAERGAGPDDWTLVLQPERERWLRAALVFDCGPTMPVWRPLWREIRQLVEQTGVFRRVDQRLVDAEGRLRYDTANDDAGPVAPDTLLTADGATVVLVVSDCMGPQWRPGPAGDRWYRRLRRWGKAVPVAVVQPLPERMWRETALPTTAGLIGSPRGAAPNSALTISAYDGEVPEGMPLPVLEPSAAWLSNWAALVAGPGSVERPGCVALLPDGGPAPAPAMSRPTEMTAEELVRRFRKTASPAAVRLAGHFSLGIPHVQVMRYIQTAVEPHSTPGQIAEVVLSGMLQSPPDDKPGFYEWRPGVKALLQRALPRSVSARTTGLLEDAGRLIAENAGTLPGRIRALVPVVARNRDPSDQAGGAQFALMDWDVLERLRGPTAIARPVPQPAPVAVAIVEAHPLVRLRLEDMVEAADGMVIAASVEDIAHLPLHPDPDVVVIDPFSTTTGPDVGRVASLAARSHVLVMSAAVRAADVVACVAAGASGYLGKHAGAHTFTTAVVTAARGEFVLSPELADILLGAAGSGAAAATLSATETAMLRAAAEGLGPAAIARRLGVATDEVRQCIAGVWAAYRGSRPTGDAEAPGGAVNDR